MEQLFEKDFLPLKHKQYLQRLKNEGFEPKVIYDVGSCLLHWANYAKSLWPNATIILFEAFEEFEQYYKIHLYKYYIATLGETDGKEVKFYFNAEHPTGNSYYRETTEFFSDETFKETITVKLDSLVEKNNIPLPDFIKIDVQGSEVDILKGGLNTIKHCQHLIVELQHEVYNKNAPLVYESFPFIESLDFTCVEPLFCDNGVDGDYGFKNNSKF